MKCFIAFMLFAVMALCLGSVGATANQCNAPPGINQELSITPVMDPAFVLDIQIYQFESPWLVIAQPESVAIMPERINLAGTVNRGPGLINYLEYDATDTKSPTMLRMSCGITRKTCNDNLCG